MQEIVFVDSQEGLLSSRGGGGGGRGADILAPDLQYGSVQYGSLLGGFPLGNVPGTWYFFSTTSAKVPSDPYHYQNVTCKLY